MPEEEEEAEEEVEAAEERWEEEGEEMHLFLAGKLSLSLSKDSLACAQAIAGYISSSSSPSNSALKVGETQRCTQLLCFRRRTFRSDNNRNWWWRKENSKDR